MFYPRKSHTPVFFGTSCETKSSHHGVVLRLPNHFKLLTVFVFKMLQNFFLNLGKLLRGLACLLNVIKKHNPCEDLLRQYQTKRNQDNDDDFHKPLPIPHKGQVSFPPVNPDATTIASMTVHN